ncbi:unnamed protein product [Hymenolepis diminuta]|uniref:Uncharacterized protein n=1 Tax=Hymenolepis diminuta TaxID=6216 RepID=A0A564XZC0_HYMDI|nr:unnamed protein product [Hymenolepis diminuta]
MLDTTTTNEMEGYLVIMSIKVKQRNLEITRSLQVATSFVCEVIKELLNENNGDELAAMRKRKQEHCQRSAG